MFLPAIFTTPLAGDLVRRCGARAALWLSLGAALCGLKLLLLPHLAAVLMGMVVIAAGTFFAQAVATGFVGQAAGSERGAASNIASAHELVASPYKSAYVAAKHGPLGLTKTVAVEAAETPVTCNAICPGYVATPLVEARIDAQARAHGISRDAVIRDVLLAQQPNKRFVAAAEIGAMAVFLAGPGAAGLGGVYGFRLHRAALRHNRPRGRDRHCQQGIGAGGA